MSPRIEMLKEARTEVNAAQQNLREAIAAWETLIANLHPAAGEQADYISTAGLPLTEDYAVIGLMPGPTRQHWVMTLAGITTIGTQAAVEYVCSKTSVEQLLKPVRRAGGEIPPLEAVIRVSVSRGVPVSSQLVAVHMRTP